MRQACQRCGGLTGYIEVRTGQNCVHCSHCDQWVYNAPKTETGQRDRSVTTVHNGIKPKQRLRILERSTCRCEFCGSSGNLHVGHILSVKDGLDYGLTDIEINHDENLAALCEECNLGMGKASMAPRIYAALLLRRASIHADR